jgi:hypothetical protein
MKQIHIFPPWFPNINSKMIKVDEMLGASSMHGECRKKSVPGRLEKRDTEKI